MTKLSIFAILLLVLPNLLLAQGNYVVNTANNSTTATYGTFNTFVGPGAGTSGHAVGNRNTVVGYNAGITLTSGSFNSFFGVDAGENTTSGGLNTFLGRAAGLSNTIGNNNVFTGAFAGQSNTEGFYNVFTGSNAGYFNSTGNANVFIGYAAGYTNTVGSQNVFTGDYAGYSNTTGITNVFTGYQTGYYNTTGSNNVFSGYQTGYYNTTGICNVFTGSRSGNNNTTGRFNVFIGFQAGYNSATGSNNIIIGPNSGTAITTSDENVLMGYNSQADDGLQNAIAIGANSRVGASNAMILGNGVNVGIGTSAPTDRLEVVSPLADKSGIRLTKLTKASPASLATDQFLTVDEQGEIVKARYQLRINNASEWSDKVFAPGYNLQSLVEVEKYIDANQHLPGVPSAEQVVKDGVDLVKMNATLLEKVEELTLYSIQLEKANQQQTQQLSHQNQLLEQLEARLQALEKKKK